MDIGDYTNASDLKDIKEHLIYVQYNESDPVDVTKCKYCTSEQMLEFIDICTARIYDRIKYYEGACYIAKYLDNCGEYV